MNEFFRFLRTVVIILTGCVIAFMLFLVAMAFEERGMMPWQDEPEKITEQHFYEMWGRITLCQFVETIKDKDPKADAAYVEAGCRIYESDNAGKGRNS